MERIHDNYLCALTRKGPSGELACGGGGGGRTVARSRVGNMHENCGLRLRFERGRNAKMRCSRMGREKWPATPQCVVHHTHTGHTGRGERDTGARRDGRRGGRGGGNRGTVD